jgi:hypothetical protein
MRKVIGGIVASALVLTVVGTAVAAWTFNATTGTGFVGKGDVQLVYGWNNKQLQDNAADVKFQATSTVGTYVQWTCTKDNDNTQVRRETTRTETEGVLSSIGRLKNQITGFNLLGYDGSPTIGDPQVGGPQLNSCPNSWELTIPAGDPQPITDGATVLEVSTNGTDWFVID